MPKITITEFFDSLIKKETLKYFISHNPQFTEIMNRRGDLNPPDLIFMAYSAKNNLLCILLLLVVALLLLPLLPLFLDCSLVVGSSFPSRYECSISAAL